MSEDKRRERIRRFRLIDNAFMKVFFKDNYEAAELLLRIILNKPDIKVKDIKVESDLDNLEGRSVTLDVLAVDDKGAEFNVEIQRRSAGASAQRAGYHLSMMHTHMLKKEEPFEKLKDAYVIFITESDTIGENMPISVYETMNINNHKQFDDKRHIIYVNGAARCSTTKLGRLMEDFFCEEPDMINSPEIEKRFRYLKEDNKGVNEMMSVEDEIRQEGAEQRDIEIAMNLLALDRISLEDISKATGLPIERIRELADLKAG